MPKLLCRALAALLVGAAVRGAGAALGVVAGALLGALIPSGGWKEVYQQ